MRHPDFCDDRACLCLPVQGSRSWWYAGHHRGGVRVLSTDYGPLLETSVAQDETVDCAYPVGVHLRVVDGETGAETNAVELTPEEAEQLAAALLDSARAARLHDATDQEVQVASA